MDELDIDIETRSRVNLKDFGVYRYVEDPDFRMLMAAWSFNDSAVQVAVGHSEIMSIPGLLDPKVRKTAHNAAFERVCFSRLFGMPTGTYLPAREWHDTAAVAGEYGYPQKLEHLAVWLGGERKDTAGTRLINLFCKPNRKGGWNGPETHPEEWAQFIEYCRQDVVTLKDVKRRLGDFPTPDERAVYLADQAINDRGLLVDRDLAAAAVEAAESNRMVQELEFTRLTGVDNPSSGPQVLAWAKRVGLGITDLQAATIADALGRDDLSDDVRRALELRQELALVAFKKFAAALGTMNKDDRLRGRFRFFGAHTGRWTGSGVQPQNLPRASFTRENPDTGKMEHDWVGELGAILDLLLGNGAGAQELKKLVRAMFLGPMTIVDYNAIEARVLAWLAGEEWVLQAFRDGRDIYVETAERMGGLTRSQGKVAVLALGYNGAVGSLRAMGADGSDSQLQFLVDQWRKADPAIVSMWGEMNEAFLEGGPVGDHLVVETDGDDRAIRLPSGRAIVYHDVKWAWTTKTWPSGDTSRVFQATFRDPATPGWRTDTYGGRLTENVTQAVARDLLAAALVRLEAAHYRPVLHVHDEIGVEGVHPVETISRIMCDSPSWAAGLPVDGEGFVCDRYRKG